VKRRHVATYVAIEGGMWVASCACGFRTQEHHQKDEALDELSMHVVEARRSGRETR
jgi:hypothetical protein